MSLTPDQHHQLTDAAHRAGHESIEQYAWAMRQALAQIAGQNSGVWGRIANEAMRGHRVVDRASRAVAQRGHDHLDDHLEDTLHRDAT